MVLAARFRVSFNAKPGLPKVSDPGEGIGQVKIYADQAVGAAVGFIAIGALCLWFLNEGTDPLTVAAVGIATLVVGASAFIVGLGRWQRSRPADLARATRGFPWRKFSTGNAVGVGFLFLFAVQGWNTASIEFAAALVLGLGNAGFLLQWLIQRKIASGTGQGANGPAA